MKTLARANYLHKDGEFINTMSLQISSTDAMGCQQDIAKAESLFIATSVD